MSYRRCVTWRDVIDNDARMVYNDIMKNEKRLTLRLPEWLYSTIKQKAESEKRSINSQVLLVLEQNFVKKERGTNE